MLWDIIPMVLTSLDVNESFSDFRYRRIQDPACDPIVTTSPFHHNGDDSLGFWQDLSIIPNWFQVCSSQMTDLLHHQIALQIAACHDDLSSRETKDHHMTSDFGKNSPPQIQYSKSQRPWKKTEQRFWMKDETQWFKKLMNKLRWRKQMDYHSGIESPDAMIPCRSIVEEFERKGGREIFCSVLLLSSTEAGQYIHLQQDPAKLSKSISSTTSCRLSGRTSC